MLTLMMVIIDVAIADVKDRKEVAAFLTSGIKVLMNEYHWLVEDGKMAPTPTQNTTGANVEGLRNLISEFKVNELSKIIPLAEDKEGKLDLAEELKNRGK